MHSQTWEVPGRLDRGLHQAPLPVSLWLRADATFRMVDINDAAASFLGRSREELLGTTVTDYKGNHARGKRDMLTALRGGEPVTREIPHVLPDGSVRDIKVVYVGCGPDHLMTFLVDVTSQRHAEERLRMAENRYRTLVSAANEGVWLVDARGRTSYANAKVGRILGRPAAEIERSNLLDFVDERDRAAVSGALECPRDTPEAFEARFRDADGGELLCLLSVSAVPSDGPNPATLCLLADLTAVQRERQLRRETERRFRWMVETANEGIWTGDKDGITTFVNEAAVRALGIERDEIIGRPFSDFIDYDDAARAVRRELRRSGVPVRAEFRLRRRDGKQLEVLASLSLLRDDDGEVIGSLAMLRDITQTKAEHAELRESRERFAQVFEEVPVGMAFIGAGHLVRGHFLGANQAFHELLGYDDEHLLDLDMLAITHPDDVEHERRLANELFENERSEYELDKRFKRADGTFVWVRFRAHVLRDDRGAPLYGLGVAVNISAEKGAARATADAAARATALLESTPDAVVEVQPSGCIAEMNGAALRMFGVQQSEVAGTALADALVPDRLRARFAQAMRDWFAAADERAPVDPTETTLMRSDGSEFPAELRITPVGSGDGARLMLYVRNLALHDRAEAARREAEERFERLFRDGPVPSVVIDLAGRLTDVNNAFAQLAERESAALVGHDASTILLEAGDAHEAPWRAGSDRPGPQSVARRILRPDGRAVPVQVTASLVRDSAGAPSHWLCQCTPKVLGGVGAVRDTEPLSYRERQVLGLLAQGHDGPAIAERLSLSPETVRSYANAAREKLGAKTRTEAVALALIAGEISI